MNQTAENGSSSPSILPLRKRTLAGEPYQRPPAVEEALVALQRLSSAELAERAEISDPEHPDYVPSECVLYFVRRPTNADGPSLRDLFLVLRQRLLRAVPMPARREADRVVDLEVREQVLDTFQELLCRDRSEHDERLDYYECRFNKALAALRATARRDVHRRHQRFVPLTPDDSPGGFLAAADAVVAALPGHSGRVETDFVYRSELHSAISLLPPDERRVVELLLAGYPINSQDAEVATITRLLGCTEKTVRNRRDRAYAKLRVALNDEEST